MAHEEESEKLWNMRSFGGHPGRGLNRSTSQLVSTTEDDGTAVGQTNECAEKVKRTYQAHTYCITTHMLQICVFLRKWHM